jgi:hypothetical protein
MQRAASQMQARLVGERTQPTAESRGDGASEETRPALRPRFRSQLTLSLARTRQVRDVDAARRSNSPVSVWVYRCCTVETCSLRVVLLGLLGSLHIANENLNERRVQMSDDSEASGESAVDKKYCIELVDPRWAKLECGVCKGLFGKTSLVCLEAGTFRSVTTDELVEQALICARLARCVRARAHC